MSQHHTKRFYKTVSEFLDDYSLHSVIGDLTTQLTNNTDGSKPLSRLIRQYLHPTDPSAVLDLQVISVPHVPDLSLFVARRRSSEQLR